MKGKGHAHYASLLVLHALRGSLRFDTDCL
jgi:hypothetical protein